LQSKLRQSKILAFAIRQRDDNPRIHISIRNDNDNPKNPLITTIGTFLIMVGFTCQNVGTRELHWPAGVVATWCNIDLALCRAWL
jgi:hypothetical protein